MNGRVYGESIYRLAGNSSVFSAQVSLLSTMSKTLTHIKTITVNECSDVLLDLKDSVQFLRLVSSFSVNSVGSRRTPP